MSIILENTINRLISSSPNTTNFTIFCPTERAFLNIFPKYQDPPYRLIQYHVVPLKLNKNILETYYPRRSKLKTLLPDHNIITTTLPYFEIVSINNVDIAEWDVYNDGRVIVHGVDEFFDPALEILFYPNNRDVDSSSGMEKKIEEMRYGFTFGDYVDYWIKNPQLMVQLIWLILEVGCLIIGLCYIVHCCVLQAEDYMDDNNEDDTYVVLEEDEIKVALLA
ncbi:uncharacterized protein LOC132602754 [Lycium barbarum]|uniref:uncharacterized protein LOC132602754 n=1 Tax=Lycium barbarum TaxID=112863 RepID=UPI00293F1EAE|nr:uncharacterized protein LOC132602754 [Lycium barbarum]